jgi:hypothetical protein
MLKVEVVKAGASSISCPLIVKLVAWLLVMGASAATALKVIYALCMVDPSGMERPVNRIPTCCVPKEVGSKSSTISRSELVRTIVPKVPTSGPCSSASSALVVILLVTVGCAITSPNMKREKIPVTNKSFSFKLKPVDQQ